MKDKIGFFKNAYIFAQYSPFTFGKVDRNTGIRPLFGGYDSFNIKLESLIEADTPNEIRVYRFTPKKKQEVKFKTIIGGALHIRTRDSSIVKFEGESEWIKFNGLGIKYMSPKLNLIITYKDSEPFPIVESVKMQLQVKYKILGKTSDLKINTIMYATEYNIDNSNKEYLEGGKLIKAIKDHKYDPDFWQNNPIIKRTPIENKIIEDFNKREYFGNFEL